MSETFVLGMNAKIYQGTSAAALSAMAEMGNVTDVTLTMDTGEADVTTRANSGWRATAATLKQCSVEFQMLWKPGDVGFEAIRTAWLNASTLELAPLTGDKDTADSEGPKGSFTITGFTRSEPLEEGVKVSVTAKLAVFDEWVKVA
jgi:hypothetical protein